MRIHRLTIVLGILGIMALMAANVFWTQDHFVVWSGNQQQDYTRAEHPQLFAISALSSLVFGLLFLGAAFYTHFGLQLRRAPATGPWGLSWYAIIMVGLGLLFALAAVITGGFHR